MSLAPVPSLDSPGLDTCVLADLPDITVITPVFDSTKTKIIFFTASRGHHADVGGILPGSMPPTSTTIFQEGAQVTSFKVVRAGKYDREGLVKRLVDEPASYPGSSGSRCFRDVESDLQAQIAANNRGVQLLTARASRASSRTLRVSHAFSDAVIDEYGLETVQAYMMHIRNNAEHAVRDLLKKAAMRAGSHTLHAIDYMDDGSPIELTITIDPNAGSAVFDFEGTGPESWSSLNAPLAVCSSACVELACVAEQLADLSMQCHLLHADPRRRGYPAQCWLPRTNRVPRARRLNPQPERDVCRCWRQCHDKPEVRGSDSIPFSLVDASACPSG